MDRPEKIHSGAKGEVASLRMGPLHLWARKNVFTRGSRSRLLLTHTS